MKEKVKERKERGKVGRWFLSLFILAICCQIFLACDAICDPAMTTSVLQAGRGERSEVETFQVSVSVFFFWKFSA